jgi:hypothetical protein
MAWVVIANAQLNARSLSSPDALNDWILRGWEPVGPAADGADEPTTTVAEWAAELQRRAEVLQAALDPNQPERH